MNSDEKNKYSSNIEDFRSEDKYDMAKDDRKLNKGHKRSTEEKPEPDIRKGVHHDPKNTPLKSPERINKKLNKPIEMEKSNVTKEESPTEMDMHHYYIPDAKTKQPKEHPCVKKEKWVDVPGGEEILVKHDKKETEIIRDKKNQYQGKTGSHSNAHPGN